MESFSDFTTRCSRWKVTIRILMAHRCENWVYQENKLRSLKLHAQSKQTGDKELNYNLPDLSSLPPTALPQDNVVLETHYYQLLMNSLH